MPHHSRYSDESPESPVSAESADAGLMFPSAAAASSPEDESFYSGSDRSGSDRSTPVSSISAQSAGKAGAQGRVSGSKKDEEDEESNSDDSMVVPDSGEEDESQTYTPNESSQASQSTQGDSEANEAIQSESESAISTTEEAARRAQGLKFPASHTLPEGISSRNILRDRKRKRRQPERYHETLGQQDFIEVLIGKPEIDYSPAGLAGSSSGFESIHSSDPCSDEGYGDEEDEEDDGATHSVTGSPKRSYEDDGGCVDEDQEEDAYPVHSVYSRSGSPSGLVAKRMRNL